MDQRRLLQLAGVELSQKDSGERVILNEESNDEVMFREELKDIASAIMNGWHRAKMMGMDYEEYIHVVKKVSDGAIADLEN